jgi:hypothetical protein
MVLAVKIDNPEDVIIPERNKNFRPAFWNLPPVVLILLH